MKPDAYQFRCKWDDGTVSEWFEINERQMLNIRDNPKYEIRGLYTAATWQADEREASAPVASAVRWPTMPPSKGQSPVLFEDGYAEGWAKCMDECQRAVSLASAPVAELETMEEIHRRERERAPWKLPKDPTLPDSAPVTDESPMAKMAEALRDKARQEQQAYQDRRNQATEWGPMPEGTEADNPTSSAPVAGEYTSAMGEAAEAYLKSFPYAHKLPAQFRWADLWAAMSDATPQASAQGQYPHDTAIYIKGESVIVYSEVLDSGEREALVEKVRTLLRSS